MRYRPDELHTYAPDRPCPDCGRLDGLEVDWVDVTTLDEYARGERYLVPGILTCTHHLHGFADPDLGSSWAAVPGQQIPPGGAPVEWKE